ncbi:MAG: circadian clock protein KaiA [Oscillatoriophycideae cyanobacterium NC_groundwater_1537_Pr4_S-0.65um_50_18]|nr:circadian clock protein KaiA [Oscillatoriophycideae cyanobacterium NC_groundwater_1537_Pr4_S-0.65um_50_18]
MGRYKLTQISSETQFLQVISQENFHVDCFIFYEASISQKLLDQLQQQAIFFPAVVLMPKGSASENVPAANTPTAELAADFSPSRWVYHTAMLELPWEQLDQIERAIEAAINKFIQLLPISQIESSASLPLGSDKTQLTQKSLISQQMRLAERLKERLGYLGVYYKRSPQNFLRHMSLPQREELLQELKADYREIILSYFSDESGLNQKIDNFVNIVFFADVPVSQIVEIHMGLMDEFSKQLKLEGRSDEILQDYRLTLIDTLAHLCEMYRRSIPRES